MDSMPVVEMTVVRKWRSVEEVSAGGDLFGNPTRQRGRMSDKLPSNRMTPPAGFRPRKIETASIRLRFGGLNPSQPAASSRPRIAVARRVSEGREGNRDHR
jgi:hypothetical protein